MEVAAVSTRKRRGEEKPVTVTSITGRRSQVSSGMFSADRDPAEARTSRRKELRKTGCDMGALPANREHYATKTNVRAIIFLGLKYARMPVSPVAKPEFRPRKGVRTRESILRAAVDLASVEGLEGLTIGRL